MSPPRAGMEESLRSGERDSHRWPSQVEYFSGFREAYHPADSQRWPRQTGIGPWTDQCVALTRIHQPVHDVKYSQPELEHAVPLGQENKVVQEDLAKQLGNLNPHIADTWRVQMIDLGLQELRDEREEHLAKDSSPFLMVGRGKLGRQK